MSKRLQVVLDDAQYRELERSARRNRTTVSDIVRRALSELQRGEPVRESQRKLQVVREAARHSYPAPEIEQMLDEIDRGRLARECAKLDKRAERILADEGLDLIAD